MNRDSEMTELDQLEQVEDVEQFEQPEIPGSSTADVVTLLFMAAMIIATVACFIFLM